MVAADFSGADQGPPPPTDGSSSPGDVSPAEQSFEEDPVVYPASLATDCKPLEEVGVSFGMFLAMTDAERLRLMDIIELDPAQHGRIELVAAKETTVDIDRAFYLPRLKQFFQKNSATLGNRIRSVQRTYKPLRSSTSGGYDRTAPYGQPVVATRLAHNFAGLVNQSSTCYLNALLQSLYHLPAFRRAIYNLQVPDGTLATANIPLALQQLFLSLERKERTRTVDLTKAFGWDHFQAAIQHDIHELVRKLFDVLEHQFNEEAKSNGTPVVAAGETGSANPIHKLFVGKRLYFSKCLDVDYTSAREEVLYDLEAVVKDQANVEASLKQETTPERLAGSNKYCWEHDDEPKDPETKKYRKTYHEADRGVAYRELPPVLMVHPNRLDFDMQTLQRVTVNTRWEFGNELDMAPYMESGTSPLAQHVVEAQRKEAGSSKHADPAAAGVSSPSSSNDNKYTLRSVVIHSGGATYGHYYCYVHLDGGWVKFNDESVTDVSESSVWADAFSGTTTDRWGYSVSSQTRASLLIYVRNTDADAVLAPIRPDEIPSRVKNMIDAQRDAAEEERKKAERDLELSRVPIIAADNTGGDLLKWMRDLRNAPVEKLDPKTTFDSVEKFRGATLWRLSNYFACSMSYRTSGVSATFVNPAATIGEYFTKPTSAHYTASSYVLIVVPHNVAPPPAVGEVPLLIIAQQFTNVSSIEFAGVFTSRERFLARFGTSSSSPSPDTNAPAIAITSLADAPPGTLTKPSITSGDDGALLGISLDVRRAEDVSSAGASGTNTDAGSLADDVDAVTDPDVPSTATPITASAADLATNKPAWTFLVEAAKKLETCTPAAMVSGDLVLAVPPGVEPALAQRHHDLLYHSLEVTLYHMPTAFTDAMDRMQSTDTDDLDPAVTPTPESAPTFPANSSAPVTEPVEVGKINVVEDDTFDDLQKVVAEFLGDASVDPKRIGFRCHSASADSAHKNLAVRMPAKVPYSQYSPRQRSVKQVLSNDSTYVVCRLYYELLPFTVEEFESKGLRDFVMVDGPLKRHVWLPKPSSSSYMYVADVRKLRAEAAAQIAIPPTRLALIATDYYGRFDDVFAELECSAPSTASANPVSSIPAPTADAVPAVTVEAPTALDADAGGMDSQPPTEPTSPRPELSAKVVLPYSTPTYMTCDSTHLSVIPPSPPLDLENPNRRWTLVVVQHSSSRNMDDLFGFPTMVHVCETDTGEIARRRILDYVQPDRSKTEKWNLLWLSRKPPVVPVTVQADTKLSDLLSDQSATSIRFSGSFVVERPRPSGFKTKNRPSHHGGEPELRIYAQGASLANADAAAAGSNARDGSRP